MTDDERIIREGIDDPAKADEAIKLLAEAAHLLRRQTSEIERLRKEDEIKASVNQSLLDEVERLRAELAEAKSPAKCDCDLRTRLVGDGCDKCNPAQALEYAKETIAELEAELAEAKRDADRWRYARMVLCTEDIENAHFLALHSRMNSGDEAAKADAAIDAARGAG